MRQRLAVFPEPDLKYIGCMKQFYIRRKVREYLNKVFELFKQMKILLRATSQAKEGTVAASLQEQP